MTGMSTRRKKQRMAAISYGPTEPPVNIEPPEITGMFGVGQTVTCTPGVWEGADTIAFQWLADGVEIPGETGSTLDLTVDYIGQQIDCEVTATNALGSTAVVAVGEEVWAATPAKLFADGQDGVWLDPSDHSTLWIDEERTQNATQPGDVVWWIDDKSGNDNHFSVGASANRSRLVRWPASAVREGYVRNLLTETETLNSPWDSRYIDTSINSDGTTRCTKNTSDLLAAQVSSTGVFSVQENTLMVARVAIRRGNTRYAFLRTAAGATSNNTRRAIFDLEDLVVTYSNISNNPEHFIYEQDENIIMGFSILATPDFDQPSRSFVFGVCDDPSDIRVAAEGSYLDFVHAQAEYGDTPTPYQRVGAGIWDVTEEGQPDCWGIEANGINNRYVSERGIPEYVDGKVRMLVGQTRFNPGGSNNVIMSNQDSASTAGGVRVLSNANMNYAAGTYATSYSGVTDGPYPENDTKILDVQAELSASANSITLRTNNNDPVSASGDGYASGINNGNWGMFAFKSGGNPYNGILWGLILTAYAPDETLWDRVARDWLNSTNMPGVLDDD